MYAKLRCATGMVGVLLFGLGGNAPGGEFAPYTYGRWVPVGPGHGGNVEVIHLHPTDPNVLIVGSDACGTALTCDGGQTWSSVNEGLLGGQDPNHTNGYTNGIGYTAVEWDPVDANYVYMFSQVLWRGQLHRGSPGRVDWTWMGMADPNRGWHGECIVFDPVPDPDGVGTAQYFYMVNGHGYIHFTNDGGRHISLVGRIPGYTGNDYMKYKGCQNPLLAVYGLSARQARIVAVACPNSPMMAAIFHNQIDPNEPNWPASKYADPNYYTNQDYWMTDDPNDPNFGLPTTGGANGIAVVRLSQLDYRAVLACDNYGTMPGGVRTRVPATVPPWVERGDEFLDPNDLLNSLFIHPSDPNICFVSHPDGAARPRGGFYRTRNLWAADPNMTTWEQITLSSGPSKNMTLGTELRVEPIGGWAIQVSQSDPNIYYCSIDSLGIFRSANAGETWIQVYTTSDDPNTGWWRNRGLFSIHTQSITMAPSDPNIFFTGNNDGIGCYKTTDQGRTFRKYFCPHKDSHIDSAPQYITYSAPGVTPYSQPAWWFGSGPRSGWNVSLIESNVLSGLVHPRDPNRAWFVTYDEPTIHTSVVVKTTDGGSSLTIVMPDTATDANLPTLAYNHYLQIAGDRDCNRLYLAAGWEGIKVSTDNGDSWSTCLNPADSNIVHPNDYDATWFRSGPYDNSKPRGPYFVTVQVARSDPNVVYCATGTTGWKNYIAPGYVHKSTDAGRTWRRTTALNGGDPNIHDANDAGRIKQLVVHPEDPNVVYLCSYLDSYGNGYRLRSIDYGVWKTSDGGASWTKVFPTDPNTRAAYCEAVAIDPWKPNTIYCTLNERNLPFAYMPRPGIYVSHDSGSSWQPLGDHNCHDPNSFDYPLSHVITKYYSLDVHPATGDVYVGTPAGAYWWTQPDRILKAGGASYDPNDSNSIGGGIVLLDGQAEDANNPWQRTCDKGTEVTLNAVADANHHFVSWVGDVPTGVDPCDPQLVVTMDIHRRIWAGFGQDRTLVVGACTGDPNEPNTCGGGAVYRNGQSSDANNPWSYTSNNWAEVTLNAVGDSAHTFIMWLGDLPSGADPCDPQLVVPMNTNRQIWAGFGLDRVLKVGTRKGDPNDPNCLGGGHVYVNGELPDANNPWYYGSGDWAMLLLDAVQTSPYIFVCWTGDVPVGQDPCDPELVAVMDSDHELWALFRWPHLKGGTSKGDPNDPNKWGGGTIYLDGEAVDSNNPWLYTHDQQTQVTLNAVADGNYCFVMWLGDVPSSADPCDPQLVVPMDIDRQVWAGFGLPRVLKAGGCKDDPRDPNNIGGGTVQVNGLSIDANNPWFHTFGDWAVLRLTAVKDAGFVPSFSVWVGDVPEDQDANQPEIFVTMDTDREIWAVFKCGGSGLGSLGLPLMAGTSCGLLFVRLARWRRR